MTTEQDQIPSAPGGADADPHTGRVLAKRHGFGVVRVTAGRRKMPTDDVLLPELGGSASSLASQAAVELDNLRLGRSSDVSAVRGLADLIAGHFVVVAGATPAAHGAATIGVMNRALAAADIGRPPLSRVDEVVAEAERIANTLRQIAGSPLAYKDQNPAEIERMRSFCVAYATQLAATRRSRSGGPQHPYKR